MDVFQVVLARAFEHQARRGVGDQALEAQAHLLATAQIGTGHGVGLLQRGRWAVKHHLATALAGTRAHVQNAISGQHHRRVVFDHHQGVARVAQALHGFGDATHVARVQANAGLIEHKQGVDQGGAQGGGEVDALHLAAAQAAALPVQREVANAHIAQVAQAGADLAQQQSQGLGVGARRLGLHTVKKHPQAVDGHEHQVVQAQTWQGLELCARPTHARRHEALRRRQHPRGIGRAAHAPQQTIGFQARTQTIRATGVAAVLGQQHPDVHLVGLGLQVGKKAPHPIPLLVPHALPLRRTFDHPVLLLGGELVPSGVARDARRFGVAHQIVLALFPGRGLHRLDGPGAQGEFVVGDDQTKVNANDAAKAAAGFARAQRRVERKHRRRGFAVSQIAVGAVQATGKAPHRFSGGIDRRHCLGRAGGGADVSGGCGGGCGLGLHMHLHATGTAFERGLQCLHGARFFHRGQAKAIGHHVEQFARARHTGHLALGVDAAEATGQQPLLHLIGRGVGGQFDGESDHHPGLTGQFSTAAQHLGVNGFGGVVAHRLCGLAVKQLRGAGKHQLQVVVELGHRAHGGARAAHWVGLVDGDRWRHALHLVHRRAVHAVQELARIGAEGLHITALTFCKQGVKHQAGLARTAGPGDHRQLAGADVDVEVFEVVLTSTTDADETLGHNGFIRGWAVILESAPPQQGAGPKISAGQQRRDQWWQLAPNGITQIAPHSQGFPLHAPTKRFWVS